MEAGLRRYWFTSVRRPPGRDSSRIDLEGVDPRRGEDLPGISGPDALDTRLEVSEFVDVALLDDDPMPTREDELRLVISELE